MVVMYVGVDIGGGGIITSNASGWIIISEWKERKEISCLNEKAMINVDYLIRKYCFVKADGDVLANRAMIEQMILEAIKQSKEQEYKPNLKESPMTVKILLLCGFIRIKHEGDDNEYAYVRTKSAISVKHYPAVAGAYDPTDHFYALHDWKHLCEVRSFAHLVRLCLDIEGDAYPITIKDT